MGTVYLQVFCYDEIAALVGFAFHYAEECIDVVIHIFLILGPGNHSLTDRHQTPLCSSGL